MAFKIPSIPKLKQPFKAQSKLKTECSELPSTKIDDLKLDRTIGSGNFGKVSLYQQGNRYVIMKEMLGDSDDEERLFIKEVKLLSTIKHQNIVNFEGIVDSDVKSAFLMEYVCFDLSPFGHQLKISNLNQLIKNLDCSDYAGFKHLQPIIAEDISKGLAFLHEKDIVHRDLKPDNVLVSNQHYIELENFEDIWLKRPVVAKLSDFGESRSLLVQTNSLIHTRTDNVNRGTPVYMAPEIHLDCTKTNSLGELKATDVWSMAMCFYTLLNPNTRYPYEQEVKTALNTGVTNKTVMGIILKTGKLPCFNPKYEETRQTDWESLVKIYKKTAKFDATQRPNAEEVKQYFEDCREQAPEVQSRNIFEVFGKVPDPTTISRREIDTSSNRPSANVTNADKETTGHVRQNVQRQQGGPAHINNKDNTPLGSKIQSNASAEGSSCQGNKYLSTEYQLAKDQDANHQQHSLKAPLNGHQHGEYKTQEKSMTCRKQPSYEPHADPGQPVQTLKVVNDCQLREVQTSDERIEFLDANIGLQPENQTELIQEFQRVRRVTMGDFHQASSDVFQHAAVGTQCSSISLVSLIAAVYKDPDCWTTCDINDIITAGDKLHLRTLLDKGWPYGRNEAKLDADELPTEVEIVFQGTCVTASSCVTNNVICCLARDARMKVQRVFDNTDRALLLCRVGDKCRAIIFKNNVFYLFDPHACNKRGEICPEGTAGIFMFQSMHDVFTQLFSLEENQQVDFNVCDIEILSEKIVLEDSLDAEGTISYAVDIDEYSRSTDSHLPSDHESLETPYTDSTGFSDEEVSTTYGKPLRERKNGLSLKEIVNLCVFKTHDISKICGKVPIPRSNSVFLIDTEKVNVKDLTCDDSGTYDSHASPSVLIKAIVSKGRVIDTEPITRIKKNMTTDLLNKESNFLIKRKYSFKLDIADRKQVRIVSLVYEKGIQARFAVAQYIGNWSIRFKPHKNSKSKNVYIRTKPSVLEKGKSLSENRSAKEVINLIDSEKENLLTDASLGDRAQNRQQIYNIKKKIPTISKSRNTGPVKTADFQKLILSMDTQKFLRDIDFSFRDVKGRIAPNTFAATTNTLNMIKMYCSTTSKYKSQLAIDMTYKVGPFFTTCLSMAHPAFVHKTQPSRQPSIFVAMMTSTTRTQQDYCYLATQLKKQGVKNLIYGTDGEVALEKGLEDVFPIEEKNIHLRCFNHVKDDLKIELNKLKVEKQQQQQIIDDILGREHQSIRIKGLVDIGKDNFESHYKNISKTWPQSFKIYFESKCMKTRSLKDSIFKCMSREVRIEAGLGNPPNKYENQRAESINNVLKQAVGGFVDQAHVHDVVYSNVVLPQERECIKAISCQGEYRLSEEFKHFEVPPSKWLSMTQQQRQQHIKKILSPSTLTETDENSIYRKLSVQPAECLEYLQNIPQSLIQEIWTKAERLLSHARISDIDEHSSCIIYQENVHIVRRSGCKFECTCEFFKKGRICSHTLVIADNRCSIFDFLKNRSYDPSHAIKRHCSPSSGEKRVKKPRKGKQNIFKVPIETEISRPFSTSHTGMLELNEQRPFQFTDIWQNDEPFVIEFVHSVAKPKEQLSCISCNCTISKKSVEPYDIVLSHKERYRYPIKEDGRTVMKPTFKKMAKRFYCLKRECVLNRHPYFWNGLIQYQIELKDGHKKLLREIFGFVI